jgi:hypothetical protein
MKCTDLKFPDALENPKWEWSIFMPEITWEDDYEDEATMERMATMEMDLEDFLDSCRVHVNTKIFKYTWVGR